MLTKNNLTLYKLLLKHGKSTILSLSKNSTMSRSTVHHNIEKLIELGLAKEIVENNRRFIIAQPPHKLKDLHRKEEQMVERKLEDLKSSEKDLDALIIDLAKIRELENLPETHIQYITAMPQLRKLYGHVLSSKYVYAIVNSEEIHKIFPENIEKFYNAAINSDIELRDLVPNSPKSHEFVEKFQHGNYQFKILPEKYSISAMDYLLYDGHITYVQGGSKPHAIVIHNQFLYENAVSMYKLLWSLLPEVDL